MERLYDLHFELSNEDRLSILHLLKERPEKLTHISKEIQITNQQCIRHLNRLIEAGMVAKTIEGLYRLTPLGDISLKLNQGFSFIAKNRDYFLTHTLEKLPDQFVARARMYELLEKLFCRGNELRCNLRGYTRLLR